MITTLKPKHIRDLIADLLPTLPTTPVLSDKAEDAIRKNAVMALLKRRCPAWFAAHGAYAPRAKTWPAAQMIISTSQRFEVSPATLINQVPTNPQNMFAILNYIRRNGIRRELHDQTWNQWLNQITAQAHTPGPNTSAT